MQRRPLTLVTSALSAATLTAAALTTAVATGQPAAATTLSSNWYAAAPYLMPLDNNPPDPGTVMSATGIKAFQLAFILAPNGGGCSPTWDGTAPVSSDTAVAGMIGNIRARGGDVSVSIGGYNGTKLGQACSDPSSTAAAYQQVIDKYGLKAMDFDLEEPEYENSTAIHNEIGAARILQQNNPGIYISVTTAGTTSGTGWFGQQMLNEAKAQGFTPNNFSIMPFDGGFNGGSSQTAALTSFNSILQSTFGWDAATAYAHEGFSGMNGRSDSGEYFYQSDFQTVLDYATSHHMARYTFWSVNRDRQCNPPDNNGTTSGTCSSVPQADWDFTKFSVQFAGGSTTPVNDFSVGVSPSSASVAPGGSASATVSTAVTSGSAQTVSLSASGAPSGVTASLSPTSVTAGGSSTLSVSVSSSAAAGTYPITVTGTAASGSHTATYTLTVTSSGGGGGGGGGSLVNGGFESGSLSPWVCQSGSKVTSSPVHSGSYAVDVVPSSSTTGECDQSLTLSPNTSYTLSGWVQGNYAYIGVSGGANASTWVSGSSWTKLSVPFTTDSTGQVTVYVHGWYVQGDVYGDDFSVS